MRGAFQVFGNCQGCHAAVVDDVVTTGSTAMAMIRALRQAGVAEVEIWAVARTL